MRYEKKYLAKEVESHLKKSDYCFLANFHGLSVSDVAELRSLLKKEGAEYHVVKNSILNAASKNLDLPDLSAFLKGFTAIVFGGENPSEVAKILEKFQKEKDKLSAKGGFLKNKILSEDDISELAKLPSLDVLKAQLLALFNAPAQQMLSVMNAAPQSFLNVLNARSENG